MIALAIGLLFLQASSDARLRGADARDCVFFMHGVLDTSMGWVSNGITGSQAFAAYDQGFDVWLGNSRANPPRDHIGAHDSMWSTVEQATSSLSADSMANELPSIWPVLSL